MGPVLEEQPINWLKRFKFKFKFKKILFRNTVKFSVHKVHYNTIIVYTYHINQVTNIHRNFLLLHFYFFLKNRKEKKQQKKVGN
jgi:hypothetical protein